MLSTVSGITGPGLSRSSVLLMGRVETVQNEAAPTECFGFCCGISKPKAPRAGVSQLKGQSDLQVGRTQRRY